MPICESLAEAERLVGEQLSSVLSAHSAVSERAFNTVGLVLAAAPELPHAEVSTSRKVSTVLMMRLSNDLRGVALLGLRGYSLQAAALAASVFEVAHCVAYIGDDDSRADAWGSHADPTKPVRSVRSLTEDVAKVFGADDPSKTADAPYRVYRQLCLAKHSNPLLQKHHGHYVNDEAVVATNGPDASEESVRVTRFALEHATRFALLSLAVFLHHHVPEGRQSLLANRLRQVLQELNALAKAAIAEYGQENPFPGEW